MSNSAPILSSASHAIGEPLAFASSKKAAAHVRPAGDLGDARWAGQRQR
jgi:hypothetical protein